MPEKKLIELWLDKRKLDALEKALGAQGSGVEKRPGHLPMDAIVFDGRIEVLPGRLVFQLDPEAWFDSLDAVFGTNTCTGENNDFLTVRAGYDPVKREVRGELEVLLCHGEESSESLRYSLNEVERACVGRKMEEYCLRQTGMELAAYGAQIQKSYSSPLTDFERMELFAEMCVAEMADRFCGRQRLPEAAPPDHALEADREPAQEEYGAGPVMGGIQ